MAIRYFIIGYLALNLQLANALSSHLHLYVTLGSPSDENLSLVLFNLLLCLTRPVTLLTKQGLSISSIINGCL